jgi:hypothetical protein
MNQASSPRKSIGVDPEEMVATTDVVRSVSWDNEIN